MARLTKLEREALAIAITGIQAGDTVEFFAGHPVFDDDETPETKRARTLAKALESASMKLKL